MHFQSLYCDRDDTIWGVTSLGRLYEVNTNGLVFHILSASQSDGDHSGQESVRLFNLEDGTLAAIVSQGLYVREKSKWRLRCKFPPELETMLPRCAASDREGNHWIGTEDGSLLLLSPDGVPRKLLLEDFEARANKIFEDANGIVWVATESGLLQFRRAPFQTLLLPSGDRGPVTAVAVPLNGDVWFGSVEGLFHLKGGRQPPIDTGIEGVGHQYFWAPNGISPQIS